MIGNQEFLSGLLKAEEAKHEPEDNAENKAESTIRFRIIKPNDSRSSTYASYRENLRLE